MAEDKREPVTGGEAVARYFAPQSIDDGKILAKGICVPADHHGELSVDRLVVHAPIAEDAVKKMCDLSKARGMTLRQNGRVVALSVQSLVALTAAAPRVAALRVLQDPVQEENGVPANHAHAIVVPMPDDVDEADALIDVMRGAVTGIYSVPDSALAKKK